MIEQENLTKEQQEILDKLAPHMTQEQVNHFKEQVFRTQRLLDEYVQYALNEFNPKEMDENPIYVDLKQVFLDGIDNNNKYKKELTEYIENPLSDFAVLCYYIKQRLNDETMNGLFTNYLINESDFFVRVFSVLNNLDAKINEIVWLGVDEIKNGQMITREHTQAEKIIMTIGATIVPNTIIEFNSFGEQCISVFDIFNSKLNKREKTEQKSKNEIKSATDYGIIQHTNNDINQTNALIPNLLLENITAFSKPNEKIEQALITLVNNYGSSNISLFPSQPIKHMAERRESELSILYDNLVIGLYGNYNSITQKNGLSAQKVFGMFWEKLSKSHKLTRNFLRTNPKIINISIPLQEMVDNGMYSNVYNARESVKTFIDVFLKQTIYATDYESAKENKISVGINMFTKVGLSLDGNSLIFSLNVAGLSDPTGWLKIYGSQYALTNSYRYAIKEPSVYRLNDLIYKQARIHYNIVSESGFISIPTERVKNSLNLTYTRLRDSKQEIITACEMLNKMDDVKQNYYIVIKSTREKKTPFIESRAENFFEYGQLEIRFTPNYIKKFIDTAIRPQITMTEAFNKFLIDEQRQTEYELKKERKEQFMNDLVNEQLKNMGLDIETDENSETRPMTDQSATDDGI